jgi:hypothetical protein
MAAAMGQAFAIQSFFIPVLKKVSDPSKYVLLTVLAYIVGGFAYFYIAYMGAFGIYPSIQAYGIDFWLQTQTLKTSLSNLTLDNQHGR